MQAYWRDRGRRLTVPGAARNALTIAGWGTYPETASQPSAITCVAASFCSGVGNWTSV